MCIQSPADNEMATTWKHYWGYVLGTVTVGTTGAIYYEQIKGDEGKPYLVFLHEGLGCTGMWGNFPTRLCTLTGCPGLLYDRLGYGQSSPLAARRTIHYVHNYALVELPVLLDTIIPGKGYILIGHSDGGSIALISAAERPILLRGVVSEAAHVFVEPETTAGIRLADTAFAEGKFRGLQKYHGEKTRQIFQAWSQTWLSDWFQFWNIEYLLPSIICPLLVIQGRQDQYGTEKQVQAIVAGTGEGTETLLVNECGHVPHLEQAELVLEKMALFIAKVSEQR